MSSTPICLIRTFRNGDQDYIQSIITEATMEQVNTFFLSALFSEILIQVSAALVGFGFIVLAIPFKYCIFCIPTAIVLLYIVIWLGHYMKAHELSNDAFNISSNYMTDPSTCFFVAELYGKAGEAEMAHLLRKQKKVEYIFCNEKEFQSKDYNVAGLSKTVVGCIAITKSMRQSGRAWLRRMSVKTEYRRRSIATNLVQQAIEFCERKDYEGIDLITTTCHEQARDMYMNEGFTVVDTSFKSNFGIGPKQDIYTMYRPINKEKKEEETSTKLIDI